MTYCPPWPTSAETAGLACERAFNPCGTGEWGCDVGLVAGTTLVAPFAGLVRSFVPCCPGCTGSCYCWGCQTETGCGRLILADGPAGEAIGLGHVKPLVAVGSQVSCGQPIATVQGDACGGSHTEFMYFPSGTVSCGTAVQPSAYLAMLFSQPSSSSSSSPSSSSSSSSSSSPTPPCPAGYTSVGSYCYPPPAPSSGFLPALLILAGGGVLAYAAYEHVPAFRRDIQRVRARL